MNKPRPQEEETNHMEGFLGRIVSDLNVFSSFGSVLQKNSNTRLRTGEVRNNVVVAPRMHN